MARLAVKKGARFGRLVVEQVSRDEEDRKLRATVLCDCGTRKVVRASNLMTGHTTSCGCFHSERVRETHTKHGYRGNDRAKPEYEAWQSMIDRCYEPRCHSYPHYGGKGVTVCAKWRRDFKAFLDDVGPRPSPDHQLGRRSRSKNYTPSNTYWATRFESDRSRSNNRFFTINGETLCLEDWAERYDIPKSTLHYRLAKGMSMRDALDVGRGRSGRALPS